MKRLAFNIFLIFSLLWNSVFATQLAAPMNASTKVEHAVLHAHKVSHHHHPDGSFHFDHSSASAKHALSDHSVTTALFMPKPEHSLSPLGLAAPLARTEPVVSDPPLDSLFRPPRQIT